MVEMNYSHPNFQTDNIEVQTVLNTQSHKIVRMEYPDGVIVVYDLNEGDINITSNYGFITDGYNIHPDLDEPNSNFKDVL
ncbi:hypothetical protein [Aerococcus tenax]|uniref:hypothetical protein n=1 Tax=Aerococcus tenax TaxID=3078812 RepID=UPI0018A74304|nr:hypothetical protein [Aerococcus tenax]